MSRLSMHLRLLHFLPALSLVLFACATKSDVPPTTVLHNAILAHQQLPAANVSVQLTMQSVPYGTADISGTIDMDGIIQRGGSQVHAQVQGAGTAQTVDGTVRWNVQGELIIADESEQYIRIHSLTVEPPTVVLSDEQIEQLMRSWWKIPTAQSSDAPGITPDPALLKKQAELIHVQQDHGIISYRGNKVHKYDASIDQEKLTAFFKELDNQERNTMYSNPWLQSTIRGEVLIDTRTSVIRRAEWHMQRSDAPQSRIDLIVELTDAEEEVSIAPPSSAQDLPLTPLQQPAIRITPIE